MSGDRSQRIFTFITGKIGNLGLAVEPDKSVLWREINNAMRHFVEDLGCSKVPYELDLSPGDKAYPIDPWIEKITGWQVRRGSDIDNCNTPNFRLTLPDTNIADADRSIYIEDYATEIQEGDVLILSCKIAVPDDYEMDETHDPVTSKRFDRLIEEYVIAGYSKGEIKQKGGGYMPVSLIMQQDVDRKVMKRIQDSYAINRAGVMPFNQLRFGN